MSPVKPLYAQDLLRVGEPKPTPLPTENELDVSALVPWPYVNVAPRTTNSNTISISLGAPTMSTNVPLVHPTDKPTALPEPIPFEDSKIAPVVNTVLDTPTKLSTKFVLSSNPFGPSVNVTIKSRGDHLTLGLNLYLHLDNRNLML